MRNRWLYEYTFGIVSNDNYIVRGTMRGTSSEAVVDAVTRRADVLGFRWKTCSVVGPYPDQALAVQTSF